MITIISGTNRLGAYTYTVSEIYASILHEKGETCRIIDLKDLPDDFVFSAMFQNEGGNPVFNNIQKIVDETEKFVFVVPEYNGSFPGILKAFMDGLQYPGSFKDKAAALVGISSGSMGGALALSHLTDVLNYLGAYVLPLKPRLAGITRSIGEDQTFSNQVYYDLLQMQAEQLMRLPLSKDYLAL